MQKITGILTLIIAFGCFAVATYLKNPSNQTGILLLSNVEAQATPGESWWDDLFGPKKDKKRESILVYCKETTVTVTQWVSMDLTGQVTGIGIFTGGAVQLQSGVKTGVWQSRTTTGGTGGHYATKVNCPPMGESECTEYDPCRIN